MRVPERHQLILAGILVTLACAFAFGLYAPLHNQIASVRKAREMRNCDLLKARSEMEQLPVLKKQLEIITAKVGDFDAKIPTDRNLGKFLQDLADAMNNSQLKDQMVEPKGEIKLENCTCIPIKVQCSGKITEIYQFLKSLENFDRLVRLEKIELKNASDLSGIVTLSAQADIYCRI